MLSIRLRRIGKKGHASFRVVVAEARSKAKSKLVEDLGWVDPHANKFELNKEFLLEKERRNAFGHRS